jgi:hypothetical protein
MNVVLYARPGCHLCEDLHVEVAELQQELGFTLVERNIEDDAEEMARFQYLIPVLDIENGPVLYPPHSRAAVSTALRQAAQRQQPRP